MSQTAELFRVKARIKALTEKTIARGCTEAEASMHNIQHWRSPMLRFVLSAVALPEFLQRRTPLFPILSLPRRLIRPKLRRGHETVSNPGRILGPGRVAE